MRENNPVLGFIGGCHVSGYLVEEHESFPNRLRAEFASPEVLQMPHVAIGRLHHLFSPALRTRSEYVFIQLGNYEFSASWQQILKRTVGLPPRVASCLGRSPQPASGSAATRRPVPAPAAPARTAGGTRVADVAKVALASLLYVLTWVLFRRYRQQFRLMNRVVQQNPQTTFVCLSPFPSAAGPHNLLRRLGGRILRHRFTAYPNLRWVDTHQVLGRQHAFLPDGIHLNAAGHRVLAEHLQTVCSCEAA